MEAWSPVFLSENLVADWATCSVSSYLWRQITDTHDSPRIIGQVETNGKTIYVALGAPVMDPSETETEKLFLPPWILGVLGLEGLGELVNLTWMSQEAFPSATRIVLRPHDSAFHTVDAKEELERALTRLGVLQQGDTILIPIETLGGYEIAFDVMICEPANIVLADGDEVVMEFEAALDQPEPVLEPVLEPILEPVLEPFLESEAMIPIETPKGIALGGGPTRRLPDGRAWNPYR